MNSTHTATEPTKPAHTPGPLVVDGFTDCQLITKDVPVAMGRPVGIAEVYGPNMIGDARLFCAAYKLLDAAIEFDLLMRQREYELGALSDEMAAVVAKTRAAIAEATGGAA